jgi:hypothetical protein
MRQPLYLPQTRLYRPAAGSGLAKTVCTWTSRVHIQCGETSVNKDETGPV